jgi:Tol biopolymer transport system component
MPLSVGMRFGSYEISALIGAGGMGEVYRARDTQLGREVAIKALPASFTSDASRVARFEQEAKTLAALNHPNIAHIYDLERGEGTTGLVMELVEGPTLAERIAQGRVPVDEALKIATQIADALEAAHERGIVHRDLKPANVKLKADGTVKVLDFGIAKALDARQLSGPGPAVLTTPALTEAGLLLGTAAYMSPEQARGRPVDQRTDVWAFGAVLYEMLAGRPPFVGEDVTETIAALLKTEPDWSLLPPLPPLIAEFLLRRSLQKEPRQRLRAIGDARLVLEEVAAGTADYMRRDPSQVPASRLARHAPMLGVGALLIGAAAAAVATWMVKPTPEPFRPVVRATIELPPGQYLAPAALSVLALSPDASQLAYVARTRDGGGQQVYLRAMNSGETRPVPSTDGAAGLFFSPDGRWLGYFAAGELKKISVSGGVAQPLAIAPSPGGASWGSHDAIVFLPRFGGNLAAVSDRGGPAQPITQDPAEVPGFLTPESLPGDKGVVFATFKPKSAILVRAPGPNEPRALVQEQALAAPRYVSSGHLIYVQSGQLMAVPFDLDRLEPRGSPVPVVRDVLQTPEVVWPTQYSVSATGTLVYVAGATQSQLSQLVWVDRNGTETPLAATPRGYGQPRISPDGRQIAMDVSANARTELWLYDVGTDALSRLPLDGPLNGVPTWAPDSKRIAYFSMAEGPGWVFSLPIDGSGAPERLTNGEIETPMSWSSDRQHLSIVKPSPIPSIWILDVGSGKLERFPPEASSANYDAAQFSPDGRWIAYVSTEQDRTEVFLQPYPGPGGKRQVSTGGGTEPQWNPNGREIFYRIGDKLMAVDITTEPNFAIGKPRELFERHYRYNQQGQARANYDVQADGQRFLMVKPITEQAGPTQIQVVVNWTEELKRLVPTNQN